MTTRFEWIVEGKTKGSHSVYDVDLLGDSRAAVIPTVGSIVPQWYLVVPRRRAIAFTSLPRKNRVDCLSLAYEVADHLLDDGYSPVFFEHGPSSPCSSLNCGVDQAHLHIVLLAGNFVDYITNVAGADLFWNSANLDDPWGEIPPDTDYYLLISTGRAVWARAPVATSQYFRKQVARFIGLPDRWNYRDWPYVNNAEQAGELLVASAANFRVP